MKRIVTARCERCAYTFEGFAGDPLCPRCFEERMDGSVVPVYQPPPIARVIAPWWRRLLARWRACRALPSPTVAIRIPEYAGGGEVHVPTGVVRIPIAGPGAKYSG